MVVVEDSMVVVEDSTAVAEDMVEADIASLQVS
jgi:hypothetical protein